MIRNARRVHLAPGYILHHRPFRDTSRILEVITRDHGRLSLFARGVRGPKARLAAVLQPFALLLLSWTGRGEAPQLTGAESAGTLQPLAPANLMAAFYCNELLLKLTTRHDPFPAVFDAYHETLESLKRADPVERTLRLFEKRLLDVLGYGLDLGDVAPDASYHFRAGGGVVPASPDAPGALAGRSLLELAAETLHTAQALDDSRRLLQAALAHVLEGRPLTTRMVARALARREAHQ